MAKSKNSRRKNNTSSVIIIGVVLLLPIFTGSCVNAEPEPPVWKLTGPIIWNITQPRTIDFSDYVKCNGSLRIRNFEYNQTNNLGLFLNLKGYGNDLVLTINPINLSWTGDVAIKFDLVNNYNGLEAITAVNLTMTVLHADRNFLWLRVPMAPLVIVGVSFEYTVEAFSYNSPNKLNYSLLEHPTDLKINASSGKITWLIMSSENKIIPITVIASDGFSKIEHTFNLSVFILRTSIDYPTHGARLTGKVWFRGTYLGPEYGYVELTILRVGKEYDVGQTGAVSVIKNQWKSMFDVNAHYVNSGQYSLSAAACVVDKETQTTYCTDRTTVFFYADKSNSYVFADRLFIVFMMILPIICIIGIGFVMLRYSKK